MEFWKGNLLIRGRPWNMWGSRGTLGRIQIIRNHS
jgi:hypothetical protein